MKKMKAAVLKEFNKPLVIEEKEIPKPQKGEVLIRIKASGLCVSDIHIQDGIINTVKLPYTPGHEMAGVVEELGENVTGLEIGDHVTASIDLICNRCRFCLSGMTNLCKSLIRIGFEKDGSHAEYCVVPAENVFRVNKDIPFEQVAILTDAVGCMYNAIRNKANVKPGDHVLILGTGGLGMNAIQIAKVFGAQVYATSRQEDKIQLSVEMGADAAINTRNQDLYEEIVKITNGEMCDVVIDNIGIKTSINDAINLIRPGGKVIISGYNDPYFEANYQNMMKYEKEIIGMRGLRRIDIIEVIKLVEQKKIVPYVYKTVEFEKINDALDEMREGKAKGRVVIKF
ncbi:MAG: alcohol dehydrogenase catalytic domain-containing protein [Clostridiaceae bacterium]|jgi:2-desacetyl-2-hydroxyethyl bacteriochlorophyllide A dehydrogenase|nr:alcohol dehydrogenase catalytic domain-containing protein [Clostridiaceae bacterium]